MRIESHALGLTLKARGGMSRAIVEGVNLQLASGSLTAIIGESGVGKSTLLSLLAAIRQPTSGQVLADGKPMTGPSPDRILLTQQPSLLPWLSVADNVVFGCRLRGEVDNLSERLHGVVSLIGLLGFEHLYPAELSVGMAQRVCLARALIGQPRALLLDEPFGALDIFTRLRLQNELIAIWQQRPFTGILVTHDLDEALIVGQQVVILSGHPATVASVCPIDLPYPRDIASLPFFEARAQVLAKLRALSSNSPSPC